MLNRPVVANDRANVEMPMKGRGKRARLLERSPHQWSEMS
jgi:hypothetical protein